MSSSYENQWLAPDEKQRTASPLGRTTDSPKPKQGSDSPQPQQKPARKSMKEMTKAERRALQEQQRLEKQNRIAQGLPKSAKKAADMEAAKKSSQPQQQHQQQQGSGAGDDKQKKKNKGQSKVDMNQVPWLMHLDAPKRPDTAGGNKDLHPAVLKLGLYFSEHKIVGSNARCVAMLQTFSKVLDSRSAV